jgi:hypothetical protein
MFSHSAKMPSSTPGSRQLLERSRFGEIHVYPIEANTAPRCSRSSSSLTEMHSPCYTNAATFDSKWLNGFVLRHKTNIDRPFIMSVTVVITTLPSYSPPMIHRRKVMSSYQCNRSWSHIGLWDVETPTLPRVQTIISQRAVTLSVLSAGHAVKTKKKKKVKLSP